VHVISRGSDVELLCADHFTLMSGFHFTRKGLAFRVVLEYHAVWLVLEDPVCI